MCNAEVNYLKSILNSLIKHTGSVPISGNVTRFYTGMPTYESFMAFVDYLQPKALKLTPWNGTHTKEAVIDESKQPGHQGISCLKVSDQLFAVLIRLRRGLDALDVCVRFSISEATYSRLFATWIAFLSKELKMLFPFPSREQISQWMPPSFKKYFPNTRIIIDCFFYFLFLEGRLLS